MCREPHEGGVSGLAPRTVVETTEMVVYEFAEAVRMSWLALPEIIVQLCWTQSVLEPAIFKGWPGSLVAMAVPQQGHGSAMAAAWQASAVPQCNGNAMGL